MKLTIEKRKVCTGWLFISPWILGFCLFFTYPLIMTIYFSFLNLNDLNFASASFIWFKNFSDAFVVDVNFLPDFLLTAKDTLVNSIMIIIISFICALLLNESLKGRGFYRMVFFLPVVIGSGYAAQMIYGGLKTSDLIADIPTVLNYFGTGVTTAIESAMVAVFNMFWRSSVQTVILLSGLQSISPSLYEASKIDGASRWESFWKITFPMVAPITLINIIYTIVDGSTDINNLLMDYIYKMGISNLRFGYASALGLMYFLFILLVIAVIYFLISRKISVLDER